MTNSMLCFQVCRKTKSAIRMLVKGQLPGHIMRLLHTSDNEFSLELGALFQKLRENQPIEISDFTASFTAEETKHIPQLIRCAELSLLDINAALNSTEWLLNVLRQNKNMYRVEYFCFVERFFLAVGMFEKALDVRRINEALLLEKYPNHSDVHPRHFMQMFWALQAKGDHASINSLISKRTKYQWRDDSVALSAFIRTIDKEHTPIMPLKNWLKLSENRHFHSLIRNKRVAILGPANGLPSDAERQAKHDIIIMINYQPSEERPSFYPDVSYYNNGIYKELVNKGTGTDFMKNMKYSVYKFLRDQFQIEQSKVARARQACSSAGVLFCGAMNMVPRMVLDLLQFEPQEICLYGVNLYRSEQIYADHYSYISGGSSPQTGRNKYHSFASHNLISQFQFLKCLYQQGIIKADEFSRQTLDLSLDEYVRDMQKLEEKLLAQ